MKEMHNYSGRLGNQLFRHAFIYAQMREGNIPDIYLQDETYFAKYKDEIKEMLSENIGFLPFIAVHIRRGDYVGNSFYTDLTTTDYYKIALDKFEGRRFLVFSDDIEFAKDYMKQFDKDFAFSEGNDETTDLNLFASCAGHIIANSSFSYWGAYLCPNYGHKVICPPEDRYYTDGIIRTKFPESWERVLI